MNLSSLGRYQAKRRLYLFDKYTSVSLCFGGRQGLVHVNIFNEISLVCQRLEDQLFKRGRGGKKIKYESVHHPSFHQRYTYSHLYPFHPMAKKKKLACFSASLKIFYKNVKDFNQFFLISKKHSVGKHLHVCFLMSISQRMNWTEINQGFDCTVF